jgi:hypothetical protein
MKDSGVEWLGEIPIHWRVKRIKQSTIKIGSGKTPLGGEEVYIMEGHGVQPERRLLCEERPGHGEAAAG